MDLASLLLSIHQKNFQNIDSVESKINDLLESYDLDESVPDWFIDMLTAVDSRVSREGRFESVGSDIGSVLIELDEDFGWDVDDQGELITASFPKLSVDVEISREALRDDGVGCCSYRVMLVSNAN